MGSNCRQGITLVELLVVIAIMAVVAALLFPVIVESKRSGQGVGEISNMKQVYVALTMYEEDQNARPPISLGLLRTYLGGDEVLSSPLDDKRGPVEAGYWTATPFIPCTGMVYPRKISFGYLRQNSPYDESETQWEALRQNARVGIIASPWRGQAQVQKDGLICGQPLVAVAGPVMEGPIHRIQMDGSLFRLPAHRDQGFLGASVDDLFFHR